MRFSGVQASEMVSCRSSAASALLLTFLLTEPRGLHADACKSSPLPHRSDWPVYGGQAEGDHYSPLSQINRGNVHKLKEAWKYDAAEEGGLETSPIIIGRILFAYTASQKVIALEASTGTLLWKFDSGVRSTQPARGLAYWTDGRHGRILAGVTHYLYALDAQTGKVIPSFGEQGRIDLRKGLRGDYLSQSIDLTSPQVVGGLDTFDPLDPKVIAWWKAKIDEIYYLIPVFGEANEITFSLERGLKIVAGFDIVVGDENGNRSVFD